MPKKLYRSNEVTCGLYKDKENSEKKVKNGSKMPKIKISKNGK